MWWYSSFNNLLSDICQLINFELMNRSERINESFPLYYLLEQVPHGMLNLLNLLHLLGMFGVSAKARS